MMVDQTTHWAETVPVSGTSIRDSADAFFQGVPDQLTSDRGALFTSDVWASLCLRLGIKHLLTYAYHPQSNGLVESFHRQLKDALQTRLAGVQWAKHWVLLGLRAAPKETATYPQPKRSMDSPSYSLRKVQFSRDHNTGDSGEDSFSDQQFHALSHQASDFAGGINLCNGGSQDSDICVCAQRGIIPSPAPKIQYQGSYLVISHVEKLFPFGCWRPSCNSLH
jgi:hypothetical protein